MEFAADTSKISMESAEALPTDMYFEILSRASFETVKRSKSVSKELRQIINDPTFLPLHIKRTSSLFGYYFQIWRGHRVESEFVSDGNSAAAPIHPNSMEILASCDLGILCCQSREYKKNRYYVCKPATQQWQPLPNPKLRYHTVSVALVVVGSRPLHYKIVRLSHSELSHECICEIFDSKEWRWEKVQGAAAVLPYEDFILSHTIAVTVGESVYWLTMNNNVLALDLNERSFQCFPLPETVNSDYIYNWKQLMKYDGRLGLTYLTKDRESMEVWVAEGQQWTRKMVVDMKLFVEEGLQPYPNMVDFFSTDAAFVKIGDEAMLCNFRDCMVTRIKATGATTYVSKIFRLRSDFEMVDLKRPTANEKIGDFSSVQSNGSSSLFQKVWAGLLRISKARFSFLLLSN